MVQNLRDLMDRSFGEYADRPALRELVEDDDGRLEYRPITYTELRGRRDAAAAGLTAMGLSKGDRLGLLTEGGVPSVVAFLAGDLLGVACVPLCTKSPPEILVHNMSRSRLSAIVVDERGAERFAGIRTALGQPPRVIATGGELPDATPWSDVVGTAGDPPLPDLGPGDESKILFTSGSSGLPKGVLQTHGNIVANVESVWDAICDREPVRFFKSAPDYHAMGILNIYYPLSKGWLLDLARSPDRMLNDIRYSEPEGFLTVPLVLDKVFGNVRKEMEAGGLRGRLIARSVRAKQQLARGTGGVVDRLILATVGESVVAKIKEQLGRRVGGSLHTLIVGSAKADPEALDFFQDVLDIRTFEGYGATECAPLIAANTLRGRRVGSVGLPLFEVRIVAPDGRELAYGNPESGEYRTGGEEGELWVSGANVMTEYIQDPEQTARVLVEEPEGKLWYRTGDLFTMDGDGYLLFCGRVGRQFKLGNGEFVNPELLERVFTRASLVEHVVVTGRQEWSHPLVIASVDVDEARAAGIADLPDDDAVLRRFPAVAARLREQLLREADAAGLPNHERPVRVLVLPDALSEEDGTLTRGLRKVVPKAVVSRNQRLIDEVTA